MGRVGVDERTFRELQALARLGDVLSSGRPLDEIFRAAADIAISGAGAWAIVHRVLDDGALVVVAARHRDRRRAGELAQVGVLPAAVRTLVEARARLIVPATIDDVEAVAGASTEHILRAGMRSLAAAPMNAPHGIAGVLCVGDGGGPILDERDLAFVQRAANRIATGVSREISIEALAHREEHARFVAEASRLLMSSLDLQRTLQTVADIAVPALADWCAIDTLTPSGTAETVALAHHDPVRLQKARELRRRYPPRLDATSGIGLVLRTGASVLVPVVTEEGIASAAEDAEHLALLQEIGIRSVVVVPLAVGPRILGALSLVSSTESRRYGPADVAFAEEVASHAACAVDNARLYAEAQHAIALRDDFVSVASHELKTPLTAMLLTARALELAVQKDRSHDVIIDRVARLERQATRMEELVESLLDVTRLAGGRLELAPEEVDLADIAGDVIARLREQAVAAGCEVNLEVLAPARGSWDALRIDQVISNILSNALKYGAGRPVDVVIDSVDQYARLRICDRGIGIAPADRGRIFEQFERAVRSSHYVGMGLGLWIARQLVEAHGGVITVESEPGAGATFTVELPSLERAR